MTELIIYGKTGVQKAKCKSFEYHGTFLGERYLTLNISSPTPVVWSIGDYAVYRGERFELNYDPTVIKQSSSGTYGEAFKYENVKLNSLADELVRASFLDVVKSDNDIHYTSLDKFSFFAHNVSDIADRIKANLDRLYTGENAWSVVVADVGDITDKNISISGTNVWGALALVSSEFELNFKVRGRTITIGTEGVNVGKTFGYGKGNGFVTLQRNADENQAVVTRLYAYGNSKNIPSQYYKNKAQGLPNNYAINRLMLPSFSAENPQPYIDSDNAESIGVREGVVYFDGSNGLEDIYPTIEGTNLNYVVSADEIEDNGVFNEEGATIPNFHITIPDIGFDINDHLSGETATISFKTGKCAGREFTIVECKKDGNSYVLECQRSQDSDLDLYFPYKDYNISANDKFVLLNIEMPDSYVESAEQRLLTAAQEYLAKNDHVRYTYTPKIDNIFIRREYDSKTDKTQSIYYKITEGDTLDFADTDLHIEASIFIDTLIIKEGSAAIPEFEITLAEEKQPTLLERIQNSIDTTVKQYVPKVDVDLSAYQTWARTQALLGLTTIDGGLILSNTIILNDQDGNVSAGINGIVGQSNIAAWYGGNMENAKSVDRFDGSGYRANGNFSWDANGNIYLSNGATIVGSNITIGGVADSAALIHDLFEKVNIGTASNPVYAIKAKYGLYTDSFLSAFGVGGTGGGGGGESGGASSIKFGSQIFRAVDGVIDISGISISGGVSSWNDLLDKPTWIGASKPSYNFSEIGSKPTTISGYGITDAITTGNIASQHVSGILASTITSEPTTNAGALRLYNGCGGSWTSGLYSMQYASILSTGDYSRGFQLWARRGTGEEGALHFRVGKDDMTGWNDERVIIDSATIGSQSVASATDASYLKVTRKDTTANVMPKQNGFSITEINGSGGGSGTMPTAAWYHLYAAQGLDTAYNTQLALGMTADGIWYRRCHNNVWQPWKTIAFTDSNVASATKLQTARTIWGKSFDGTANVSGMLYNTSGINYTSNLTDAANIWADSKGNSRPWYGIHYINNIGEESLTIADYWGMTLRTRTDASAGVIKLQTNYVVPYANNSVDIGSNYLMWRYGYFGWVGSNGGSNFSLGASNSTHMTINTSGNVGIGTTSPTAKLHVNGTINCTQGENLLYGTYGSRLNMYYSNNIGYFSILSHNNDDEIAISATNWEGNSWTYDRFVRFTRGGNIIAKGEITAYSDKRLKTDIKDLDFRGALMPKSFVKDGKQSIGFIAQEVRELYPELVLGEETEDSYLSLNYGAITAVLACQTNDHERRIAELERENKELKRKLNIN